MEPFADQGAVGRAPPASSWFTELLVGLAALASASISLLLTRLPGGIALFWPANAIAAALLIRLPGVRWARAAIAVSGGIFLANALVAHRPWPVTVPLTCINVAEIATIVVLFRFVWRFPYPNITLEQGAIMTAVFGVAIPGLSGLAAGLVLHVYSGSPFLESTLEWWSSRIIGACLLGPPLILFDVKELKRLVRGQFLIANLATALVCLVGCYLTIRYVRFPFVSIGLLLLISAFRLGGFGASLMSLCVGLMITNLWAFGIRPLGLDPTAAASNTLLGLPVIALLATVIAPIAVGLGSDARRASARALRLSERRFRDSMQHSPIGMLIADLEGHWTYTNLALQQMLGYTAEEFRALPPGGPSRTEDWKASEKRWGPLLTDEISSYDTVRSFQHKDGHRVWTHVAVSLLRDDDGSPLHLIAQVESLEARRRVEEKLAEERERLTITLESLKDAVITTDADTRISYINAAAESLLGLELKAARGRRVGEVIYLMDPQSSKPAASLIGQSVLHGKVFRREQPCLLHRPDGTICYVTDTVSPLLDPAGLVSGLVIVLRDATLDMDRARDLQHRAMHDPLTGLSNRTDFEQTLRTVFRKSRPLDRPAAIMAIDLDRFKSVNDAAGHAAGDAVLCKVAVVCRDSVRASDTVARLGGDEFAIILDNCDEDRAKSIGQQLLGALNPLDIEWKGTRYTVGASIGLALLAPELRDERAWLEAADRACYDAKRESRGLLRVAAR